MTDMPSLEHLQQQLAQREDELAILNSVGEAMAKTLDVKTVVKIVGDKVQSIFSAEGVTIRLYDAATGLIQRAYDYDLGYQDLTDTSFPLGTGVTSKIIESKTSLLFGTSAEQTDAGATKVPTQNAPDEEMESYMGVPILVGDQAIGAVAVHSYPKNAYNKNHLRLLQTLATNMGVTIQNARLFEAEQERVAELQIINSIQQGLAAELDFQAIVDLVGDKLREVFHTGDMCIRWYDARAESLHFLYHYEHGLRITLPSAPPSVSPLWMNTLETRRPTVFNTLAEQAAMGVKVIPGTDQQKSFIHVPIIGSDRVLGDIIISNYEREYAYGESELRLLTTIAASLGTALENARLFDETQRLLKITEQRNAELAIINSVQAALGAKLEMQAIYDAVGDQIQEIFDAQAVMIVTYDKASDLAQFSYAIEKGERLHIDPRPLSGITGYVIKTGLTVMINQNMVQTEAELLGSSMAAIVGGETTSRLDVPLLIAEEARGCISLQT